MLPESRRRPRRPLPRPAPAAGRSRRPQRRPPPTVLYLSLPRDVPDETPACSTYALLTTAALELCWPSRPELVVSPALRPLKLTDRRFMIQSIMRKCAHRQAPPPTAAGPPMGRVGCRRHHSSSSRRRCRSGPPRSSPSSRRSPPRPPTPLPPSCRPPQVGGTTELEQGLGFCSWGLMSLPPTLTWVGQRALGLDAQCAAPPLGRVRLTHSCRLAACSCSSAHQGRHSCRRMHA
jgi:hypothetical protein